MSKVSIITPCYNAEKFIGKAIESVRSQSFTDWEYIIVDDGSTDNSAEVIASYTAIEPRLQLIKQQNGGVCNARNKGFKVCSPETKYLLFFDADDCLEVRMLEVMVTYLEQHPHVSMSYCDYWYIDTEDKVLPTNPYRRFVPSRFGIKELPYETSETPLIGVGSGSAVVMESCSVLRRCIYEKTLGWDECLGQGGEGIDLFMQFALLGKIHFIPKKLYKYRQYSYQSHRVINDKMQAEKLITKWTDGKWLTRDQQAKIAQAIWFYRGRLIPLREIQDARNLMQRWQVIQALSLYLKALKNYLLSLVNINPELI
ncbi:family 2 glycosyl transferase [Calothrix brevissima NIES-22]|nr:family 2 glycosyl transferase [Calothrix brevissima NIES-22]